MRSFVEKCFGNRRSTRGKFPEVGLLKNQIRFKWKPRWHIGDAVEKTVEWSKVYLADGDVNCIMEKQIREYMG